MTIDIRGLDHCSGELDRLLINPKLFIEERAEMLATAKYQQLQNITQQ